MGRRHRLARYNKDGRADLSANASNDGRTELGSGRREREMSEEDHHSKIGTGENDTSVTECVPGHETENKINISTIDADDAPCSDNNANGYGDDEIDDVEAFMYTMDDHDLDHDDENEDENDHDPRPPSASSIASFSSSVLKKIQASNVFQETSTVFNEVIKHTTFCGVQRADGNGNECGNDTVDGDDHESLRSPPPVVIEPEEENVNPLLSSASASACPPPEAIPIPLRHIQSSPTQSHRPVVNFNNGAGNGHGPMMMKRSVSTPPTFAQSRRGSAFGKVYSTQYQIHRAQNGSASAFQPVGLRNHRGPLPLSRAVSIDAGSVASTDEISVASSTSKMSAKAQNRIKARRRKMKQQKNSVPENANDGSNSGSGDGNGIGNGSGIVHGEQESTSEAFNDSFCSLGSGFSDTAAIAPKAETETDPGVKQSESIVPSQVMEVKTSSMGTPVVSNIKMMKKVKAIRKKKRGGFSNPFKKQAEVNENPVPDSVTTEPASTLAPAAGDESDTVPVALDTSNDSDTKDVSYLPLNGDNDAEAEAIDDDVAQEKEEKEDLFTELKGNESPTPIPFPAYQQINDDDNIHSNPSAHAISSSNPPLPSQPRRRSKAKGHSSPSTTNSHPRLILPLGNRSPCSQDSCSFSKSTKSGQSLNTTYNSQSHFSTTSCNRSVTSSVAEADREVRETNRRELRRFEMVDMDGTQSIQSVPSIQSSDTTSTNPHAYLVLNSSNAQLREGASMQFDRFFARNGSSTHVNVNVNGNVHTSGPSVGSGSQSNVSSLHPSLVSGNSTTSGRPPAMNARSPNTISSNSHSLAHSVSTASTGDDHHRPPSFISAKLSKKVVPVPSPSDGVGYSRLGSGSDGMMLHGMSSSSSKSSSMSSKSSSSKSRRKGTKDLSQRSYQKMRTSTPSPCNSFPASPVKTPISPPNEFNFMEPTGVRKPDVRRQMPSNHYGMNHNYNHIPSQKIVLVSPDGSGGPSFKPTSSPPVTFRGAFRGVVTPEKRSIEEHMSRFRM